MTPLTAAQRDAAEALLPYSYWIADKNPLGDAIDRRGIAHEALCEAVANYDPACGLTMREHVRRRVRDAVRASFDLRHKSNQTVNRTTEEWDGDFSRSSPPPDEAVAGREWVGFVLATLIDPEDGALARRVVLGGETIRDVAGEINTSGAYYEALKLRVRAIKNRIAAAIIADREKEKC